MILFKAVHVPLILADVKTQTRRLWPHGCRAKAGSVHWGQSSLKPDSRFARLKVLAVYRERLGDISEADAIAEGGYMILDYLQAFMEINRFRHPDAVADALNLSIYVVQFKRLSTEEDA